jgi:hypothetical protein
LSWVRLKRQRLRAGGGLKYKEISQLTLTVTTFWWAHAPSDEEEVQQ